MKRVLVIGAGKSSAVLISYLLAQADEHDWQVRVADLDQDLARSRLDGHPRGEAVGLDSQDNHRRDELISETDLVVSMLPAFLHPPVAEACVHHLFFDETDYASLGAKIKCNPAIKTAQDREALLQAVVDDRIDVIATDHAPHTAEEKASSYFHAPAGLPLVQHALLMMVEQVHSGRFTLEQVVQKTSHAVADVFGVRERGYIREGYFADLVLVDPDRPVTVRPEDLLYKCGWSPLEGYEFRSSIRATLVNGEIVWLDGKLCGPVAGQRLELG